MLRRQVKRKPSAHVTSINKIADLKPISLEKKRTRVCVCKPVHGSGYCTRWLIKGYMLVGRKATICRSLNLLVAGIPSLKKLGHVVTSNIAI